jgi:hypothetical protein
VVRHDHWRERIGIIGLFLFSLALRLIAIGHPVEVDSAHWLQEGADFLRALLTGDWLATFGGAHPGLPSMWLIGSSLAGGYGLGWRGDGGETSLLAWLAALTNNRMPALAYYLPPRLAQAVVTSALVCLFLWAARRAFSSRVAWAAAILWAFDPFVLAYTRVIVPDALAIATLAVALAAAWVWLRGRGGLRWMALAGVMLGLATASKLTCGLLGPMIALWSIWARRYTWRQRLAAIALCGLLAIATIWLIFPALWASPSATWRMYVAELAADELGPRDTFFLGQPTDTPDARFYAVVLAYRASPLLLLGSLLALAMALWPRRCLDDEERWAVAGLWAFAVIFLAAISWETGKIDRWALPAWPALALAAAIAGTAVMDALFPTIERHAEFLMRSGQAACARARNCGGRRARRPHSQDGQGDSSLRSPPPQTAVTHSAQNDMPHPWWHLALLAALQLAIILPSAPGYFSYGNPLLGGTAGASQVLMMGVGEGLDEAAAWLAAQPAAAQSTVAAFYPTSFAPFFPGQTEKWVRKLPDGELSWVRSHYVVFYVNQWQRQRDREQMAYIERLAPLHTIRQQGLEYARIYVGPLAHAPDVPSLPDGPVTFTQPEGNDAVMRLRGLARPQPDTVVLYWETIQPAPANAIIHLTLSAADGSEVASSDQPPLAGYLSARFWRPGDIMRDVQKMPVPDKMPTGALTLEISWRQVTAEGSVPLPAFSADGRPLGALLRLDAATGEALP